MSALEHVTITSGAARTSHREEVADHVVETLRAALAGDGNVGGGWTVRLLPSPAGGAVG